MFATGKGHAGISEQSQRAEHMCYCEVVECVSGDRLAAAVAIRRAQLWGTNPRLAERIEMRIKDATRAHSDAHGSSLAASRCLAERHRELTADG
jgi:hypothetical protein